MLQKNGNTLVWAMRHSVLNMIFLASYLLSAHYGAEYLIFVSSRSLKTRENFQTETTYHTRATITRSWSVTALVYKPRILGLKNEEFPFLVHKLSVI